MMICPYFLMIVWFFSLPVSASLQQGKDFGNKMLSQYGDLAIKIKPTEVLPHYTPNPKETGLNESTLDKNVVETMKTHPSAHLVKESEEKRGKHFKIHEDPLVLFSKEISQDPLALLSKFYKNCKEISVEGSPVKVETESRTCEESGDSYPLTCIKNLVVTVTKSPPTPVTFGFSLPKLWNSHRGFWNKYFKMGWGRHPQGSTFDFGGHNKGDDPGYARHFTYVPNPVLDRQFLSDLFAITDRIDVVELILVLYKGCWKKAHRGISDITREEFIQWTNSLWTFPGETSKQVKHPAPFPRELPRRCIKLFSYIGDTVLDPFSGSGTTILEALCHNRSAYGLEIDPLYLELAAKRISKGVISYI